jgi:hypothetical protein
MHGIAEGERKGSRGIEDSGLESDGESAEGGSRRHRKEKARRSGGTGRLGSERRDAGVFQRRISRAGVPSRLINDRKPLVG